jgi:transposase
MQRLQELVRLHRLGTHVREIARLLRMGPAAERKYRKVLNAAGLLAGPADDLPPLDVLRAAVEAALPPKQGKQERSSAEPWADQIVKLADKGAGPKAIYDLLQDEVEEFTASYDAVKRLVRRRAAAAPVREEDVAIPVVTPPGEVAQVDFAEVCRLYDPEQGVLRRAWLFVMVLGHSRHQFVRIVFDQKVATWLALHVEAFEYFGGVPRTIVPDNLKSAVIRAAFSPSEDVALNRSYRELARHYRFKVDPAPPRAPEKKGKVERSIRYVRQNFLAARELGDIAAANRELAHWNVSVAGQRVHGTTGRRPLEAFEEERPALLPLPASRFVPVIWHQATVHRDCQVAFEGRVYPVPWRFVGQQVWLRVLPATVEMHHDDVRVIAHTRGVTAPREVYDLCLPPKRAELRHRTREFWEERAARIHPEVGEYMREVFDQDDVLSLLRRVQAMVVHLEGFPPERARAACARARYFGNYGYRGLKDILKQGLDLEPLPVLVVPAHGALTAPRFARSVQELLNLPLEKTHEPN